MSVSYGGGEKPQYPALRKQIETYYAALLAPLKRLRASVFAAIAQPDTKAENDEFAYTEVTRETIDQAVDLFLSAMAGPDRTRDGFSARAAGPVQGDGVIQEQDRLAFVTGITRGADLMNAEPTLSAARQSPAVKEMLDNAFDRLSENGKLRLEDVRDDIHGVLASAQAAGLNPLETARQLGGQFEQYQGWEFQRLARTEAAFASEAGARGQMADLGVDKVEWLISDGACPICEDLAAGGPYDIDDEENLPPAHPNCAVGGTVVSGPAVIASTSRWYVGDVVDIQTVGGRLLTITPNHPVLTPKGWVAAGLLHEGDDVICGSGGELSASQISPDDYQIPALIEEVAAAVGRSGRVSAATVPTTAEYFHGDGGGSEVCVVRANGELGNALYAPFFDPFTEECLCRRHAEALRLARDGASAESIEAVLLASPRNLRATGHLGASIRAAASIERKLNVSPRMRGNSMLRQDAEHGRAAAFKVPSAGDLVLAGEIETDHLLLVNRRVFKGHVYNLQTAGGWFLANNIVTHNCLCSVSPVGTDVADSA